MTSAVTDMEALFAHAASFNDPLARGNSSVTTMSVLGASSFNRPFGGWKSQGHDDGIHVRGRLGLRPAHDVGYLRRHYGAMFVGASSFNQASARGRL